MNFPLAFIGWQEGLVIVALLVLVFGARRLPDLARSVARSIGEFKKARNEIEDEIRRTGETTAVSPPKTIETPATNKEEV